MKTESLSVGRAGYVPVSLGKVGEAQATRIDIDVREWDEAYPGATYLLFVSPPEPTAPYLAKVTHENGVVSWVLESEDTTTAGNGTIELILTQGNARIKSVTWSTMMMTSPSSSEAGDAPQSHPTWWEDALDKIENAKQEAIQEIDGTFDSEVAEGKAALEASGAAQQAAIENKGKNTLDSIPADYMTLANDVSTLKDQNNNLSLLLDASIIDRAEVSTHYIDSNGTLHGSINWRAYRFNTENVKIITLVETYAYSDAFYLQIAFYSKTTPSSSSFISGIQFAKANAKNTIKNIDVPKDAVLAIVTSRKQTVIDDVIRCITVKNVYDEITNMTYVKRVFDRWSDPAANASATLNSTSMDVTYVNFTRKYDGIQYAYMDCSAGDVLVLRDTASNSSHLKAYIFVDESGKVYSTIGGWHSGDDTNKSEVIIGVPAGAVGVYINRTYNSDGNAESYKLTPLLTEFEGLSTISGKTVVSFGDSIFGNFREMFGKNESISSMVSKKTGATCLNCAFGGTHAKTTNGSRAPMDFQSLVTAVIGGDWNSQLSYAQSTDDPDAYTSRVQMLASIDFSNVDIVTISYGTNDWTSNVSPEDYETALIDGITRLNQAYPNLLFVICTPIIRFKHSDNTETGDAEDTGGESSGTGAVISTDDPGWTNSNGDTLPQYAQKVENVGKTMHIPVCENYWTLGINTLNYAAFMGGMSAADMVHPNAKGRRMIANHLIDTLVRL